MTTQKVKIKTELWTQTGNRTGIFLDPGTVIETGASRIVKERPCWLIVTPLDGSSYPGAWLNKCVEQSSVELYNPPTIPTIYVTHEIKVYNDGSVDLDGIHHPPVAK
jgi:hypothetical protein